MCVFLEIMVSNKWAIAFSIVPILISLCILFFIISSEGDHIFALIGSVMVLITGVYTMIVGVVYYKYRHVFHDINYV